MQSNLRIRIAPILIVLLTAGSFSSGSSPTTTGSLGHKKEQGSDRGKLSVLVTSDKKTYSLDDSIQLQVLLMNAGGTPIFLYGYLSWGHMSSLTLDVRDEKGRAPEVLILEDALTPPPKDPSQFIKLEPGHLFGVIRCDDFEHINIREPGKYQIVVTYHSPIPKTFGFHEELWSMERGEVSSSPLYVEVLPAKPKSRRDGCSSPPSFN